MVAAGARGLIRLRHANGLYHLIVLRAEERERLYLTVTHDPVGVYDYDGACAPAGYPRADPVKAGDLSVLVREQAKWKLVVLAELAVRLYRVGRDAHYLRARLHVVGPAVPDRAHLPCADGRL